jgi:hypothetical protein
VEALVTEMVITEQVARQRIRYLRRTAEARPLTERERRNLEGLTAMFGTPHDFVSLTLLQAQSA